MTFCQNDQVNVSKIGRIPIGIAAERTAAGSGRKRSGDKAERANNEREERIKLKI